MEITYDKQADALGIVFKRGKVERTVELAPEVFLDVDRAGKPLFLEIIGAKEKLGAKPVMEFKMRDLAFAS